MKGLLLVLIRFYRRHISPMSPPSCRFIPTCSAYALEAVEVHGAWRGGRLALKRLMKCHPFHKQASFEYDPVPPARGKSAEGSRGDSDSGGRG